MTRAARDADPVGRLRRPRTRGPRPGAPPLTWIVRAARRPAGRRRTGSRRPDAGAGWLGVRVVTRAERRRRPRAGRRRPGPRCRWPRARRGAARSTGVPARRSASTLARRVRPLRLPLVPEPRARPAGRRPPPPAEPGGGGAAAPPGLDPRRAARSSTRCSRTSTSAARAGRRLPRSEAVAARGRGAGSTEAEHEDVVAARRGVRRLIAVRAPGRARRCVRREAPFAFPLEPGPRGLLVHGVVDVLAAEDGGPLVVDYKTDRLEGARARGARRPRLCGPAARLRARRPARRRARVEVAHCFLERPDEPAVAVYTAADAAALAERLVASAAGLLAGDFTPTPSRTASCAARARGGRRCAPTRRSAPCARRRPMTRHPCRT